MLEMLDIQTEGQGLYEFTQELNEIVARAAISSGLCTVFVQHTSASLLIQENADPAVQKDLSAWLSRLVRENDALYTHTAEGADDMPAHIRAALTQVSLGIPVMDGRPALGTWQGVFLFEHRRRPHLRKVLVHTSADR